MATHRATVEVDSAPDEVFAYLADPANRAAWDPSVRSVSPRDDGGFDVVVGFYGRAINTTVRTAGSDAPHRLVFDIDGRVRGRDVIEISPHGTGSTVTVDRQVQLRGAARLLDRGLQLALAGIGENIATELGRQLGRVR